MPLTHIQAMSAQSGVAASVATLENTSISHQRVLDITIAKLSNDIDKTLLNLGFSASKPLLAMMINELVPEKYDSLFTYTDKKRLQIQLLKRIDTHLFQLEKVPSFIALLQIMKSKSIKFSLESVFKLLVFSSTPEAISRLTDEIYTAKHHLIHLLPEQGSDEQIEHVLTYILMLNLNKYTYLEIFWLSLNKHIQLSQKAHLFSATYANFITINSLALTEPHYSKMRRNILFHADLLQSFLQRDPEEVEHYIQQMRGAAADKLTLLSEIWHERKSPFLLIIDVGPAGGATFKSVLALARKNPSKRVSYIGIELDKKELQRLHVLLENHTEDGLKASALLMEARFIKGNALDLSHTLQQLQAERFGKYKDEFTSIVLSSVIHEIYSYCNYESKAMHCDDFQLMTQTRDGRYNPETVYKLHYEALKSLAESSQGGTLHIRDGVMYDKPDEEITFSIESSLWLSLFKAFIQDEKYLHLQRRLLPDSIQLHHALTLPAKYVQEFILKANWGVASFGNEINEVYCYLRKSAHEKLLHQAAKALSIEIRITESRSYSQVGYKEHITDDQIKILSGFGKDHFPPTNMILKVTILPSQHYTHQHAALFSAPPKKFMLEQPTPAHGSKTEAAIHNP